jgi:hypothetical protein
VRYRPAVRVLISEPAQADTFIEFLWERKFLGIREARSSIEVAPPAGLLPYATRFLLRRSLREWNAAHPRAEASLIE